MAMAASWPRGLGGLVACGARRGLPAARRGLRHGAGGGRHVAAAASASPAAVPHPGATPALRIHNTRGRKKEAFTAGEGNKVRVYVCGVTVYDLAHIGHARCYVAFDVVVKHLRRLGHEVTYVRNYTDVDDKILKRAEERGEDPVELAARFVDEFRADMERLGCCPPDVEPKVTEHVEEIVRMVHQIVDNGAGYAAEDGSGDVYFSVASQGERYGELSGRREEDNEAGGGGRVDLGGDEAGRKRAPQDFALWKGSKSEGELGWDSPWGRGRPGWHIECSAMSCKHLGEVIDIHGGGSDLIFPHHENELAQSRAATLGRADVRYWMHNGFVKVDNEKMSKSLGNFFTVRDVLERYDPEALRWFLLCTQYRAPINHSDANLNEASSRLYYIYQTLADADDLVASLSAEELAEQREVPVAKPVLKAIADMKKEADEGMADDFNTPRVVASCTEPLKQINDILGTKAGRKMPGRAAAVEQLAAELRAGPFDYLGVGTSSPSLILGRLRAKALVRMGLTEEDILSKLEQREAARAAKDWAASDALRDELLAQGIAVMDGAGGQPSSWRPA